MNRGVMGFRRFYFLLIFALLPAWSFAQLHTQSREALRFYNAAVEDYRFLAMEKAGKEVDQAIRLDSNFIEAHLLRAEMKSDRRKYEQAINSYKEVIRIDPEFYLSAIYNLGHLEVLTGRYEQARKHLNDYISRTGTKESLVLKAKKDLKICDFAKEAMAHPVPFDPVNLGPMINTRFDEYWPSITADNMTLVFTRLQPSRSIFSLGTNSLDENFYISTWKDGKWDFAWNMGAPINTERNEGAQSLSADGHFMYFTACNRPVGKGSCDIYVSSKLSGKWSSPSDLKSPLNTKAWEAQPSIAPDGATLYFSSNRPGGFGNMDIWKSTRGTDGKWSVPVNLGEMVNTEGNEMSPHIHKDNQTLYFSSDGRIGMGGFDLYITRMQPDSSWSEPLNLGYPINTWTDEIGMVVPAAGKTAYYSSARNDTMKKDLYKFTLYPEIRPHPASYFKGKVFDSYTHRPVIARFELIDLESKKVMVRAFSDSKGEFLVCLPTDMNYALNVDKEGYLFYSDHFSLKGIQEFLHPFYRDVPLNPVRAGEKSVLRNIFFEYNSYKLKKNSEVELELLLLFMNKNQNIIIRINGYTDSKGESAYNLELSKNRAKAVYDYLIDHKIPANRISYKGFGEAAPAASNETEVGRALNRRIEIVIIQVIRKKTGG